MAKSAERGRSVADLPDKAKFTEVMRRLLRVKKQEIDKAADKLTLDKRRTGQKIK